MTDKQPEGFKDMKIISRPELFTVIAGRELLEAMEAEQDATCHKNSDGTYSSADICAMQQREARRGILGIELVESIYGTSVRYDSGLQDFGLVARASELGGTYEAAEKFAIEWVSRDPERRYAWRRTNAKRLVP